MKFKFALLTILILLAGDRTLHAHHSVLKAFDSSRPVLMTGSIAGVQVLNPHATLQLEVKAADGKLVTWTIEMAPTNAMIRSGFDPRSLAVGQTVSVEIWVSRTEQYRATGRRLTTSDGRSFDISDNWP